MKPDMPASRLDNFFYPAKNILSPINPGLCLKTFQVCKLYEQRVKPDSKIVQKKHLNPYIRPS
jgi:hypothetical protein